MAAAAILDLDGTLVTFHFNFQEWRRALLAELSRRGFDTTGLTLTTPTQTILDAARSQIPPGRPGSYEALRKDAFAILDGFEIESASKSVVIPGAKEALDRLRAKGVRMAVLTNSGRKAASESLRRAGLAGEFEFVLTRDDTEFMKPRPEGVIMAVAMLGLPPGEIYYVGDSPLDIPAAREAGVRVVSVATGSYSAERLKGEGADFVISSLSELPAVMGVLP